MLINITITTSRGTKFFIHLASEMVCDRVIATWDTATYMLVHVLKLIVSSRFEATYISFLKSVPSILVVLSIFLILIAKYYYNHKCTNFK